jgi:hypothetical protein
MQRLKVDLHFDHSEMRRYLSCFSAFNGETLVDSKHSTIRLQKNYGVESTKTKEGLRNRDMCLLVEDAR